MTWDVVGHERAVALLSRAMATDQLSHAYILSGPESIGKRTLALQLARAALCLSEDPSLVPCGECSSCTRVASSNHPDLRMVELDAEHVQISRKEIGQIQADASLKPLLGQRKVYVLVEVERLSPIAGNQLLKLLEEPPSGVIFVLTSADVGAVLPTILSRCQLIRMQPAPRTVITHHLTERLHLGSASAQAIAEEAEGRIGWAIRAGSDSSLMETRASAIEELVNLIRAPSLARLLKAQELAGRWSGDRLGVIAELDWWAHAFRDLAVHSVAAEGALRPVSSSASLTSIAGQLSTMRSVQAARATQKTARLLEQNVNPRLALDTLFLDLPRVTIGET
ncbi:MAG: ATP-binding protein [Chloroflexota bacterium]